MENFPDYKTALIKDLIPYARNSRTHSDEQVAQIAASIKEFGFLNPIIVDGENGIIAGHGRVLAAQRLGLTELPCVEACHLTDAQRKAYVIADNKLALNAGWDDDLLRVELDELGGAGFDLELTGFSLDEIDALFADGDEHGGDVPDDALVGESAPRVANAGDVFALGRHRLICGDSSDATVIETLMDGECVDLLIYDPPYDVDEAWTWAYPAPAALVFSDYRHVPQAMGVAAGYAHAYQFVWDCCQSWYTPNRPLARHKTAFYCADNPAWDYDAAIYQDGKQRTAKKVSNTRGEMDYQPLADGFVHLQTVFQESNTNQDSAHDHAKPVKWLNALMRGAGGGNVLDMFGGSGATILAAPDNTTVYAVEISESTCDRLIDRWQRATGETAVRMGDDTEAPHQAAS